MTLLAKPTFAVGTGAFFLCGVICTHFGELLATPLSLVSDFAAGVGLIVGGVLSGRHWPTSRQYQIVGWSFMVILLLHSFVGNLADAPSGASAGVFQGGTAASTELIEFSQSTYTIIVAALFFVSLCGLWMTLRTPDDAPGVNAEG